MKEQKYQFEQDKLNLENTVNQSYNDLKGAIKFYEASSKTLISLKNAFEDTTDRYRLGVLSSFDFIQAKQRYESAVSENIRAKFDYIFKTKSFRVLLLNTSYYPCRLKFIFNLNVIYLKS